MDSSSKTIQISSSSINNNNNNNLPIDNFNGYYQYLNNDYPTWIQNPNDFSQILSKKFSQQQQQQGVIQYPSVTIAYQAARTSNPQLRKKISQVQDYQQLKKLVESIKNPQNWNLKKYKVMQKLVRDKFKRNKQIAAKLIATKQRQLINKYPNNGFNQYYWGIVPPNWQGINSLGKILMTIRDQFNKGIDHQRWIQQIQTIETDITLHPKMSLIVQKQSKKIDKLFLENNSKGYFFFGSAKENDFKLDHQSISKFHACIYFDIDGRVMLVDMNSSNGTFLMKRNEKKQKEMQKSENKKINLLEPIEISSQDIITFGFSSRKYVVQIDRQILLQKINKREQEIKKQLKNIQDLKSLQNGSSGSNKKNNQFSIEQIRAKLGYNLNNLILIQNIPQKSSHRDIKQLLLQNNSGYIQNIRMCIDKKTGKHQGSAIVYFKNSKDAQSLVLSRDKTLELKGNKLEMKLIDKYEADNILNKYDVQSDKHRDNSQYHNDRRYHNNKQKQKQRDYNEKDRNYDRSRNKKNNKDY